MRNDRYVLPGSDHTAPPHLQFAGRVPRDEMVTVSLYLKPAPASTTGVREAETLAALLTRADLRASREAAHAADLAMLDTFASEAGLVVTEHDAARRLMKLQGPTHAMEAAFGTELHAYTNETGARFRGRSGSLHVPSDLDDRLLAVLGLDTTPIATSKLVPHRGAKPSTGFLPTEVATLYGLDGIQAAGQSIGLIELGGGYTDADNQAAFAAMARPVPEIIAVGVDGAANDPTDRSGANGEVALDIQVAGGVAPGARIVVYFAPNTSQGFADAITQAVHDSSNAVTTLSISWGSAEDGWSGQAIAAMHQAFADAAMLGIAVFAASGDSLATDGTEDGQAYVDYPASDPLVVGCGGTRITVAKDRISHEVVWQSNGGGTGGGVSSLFAKPDYQAKIAVPAASSDQGGRGVPDVSGNADPDSGYRIVTGGEVGIVGGTSAVAPLWAAIVAGLNAERGAALGDPHAWFYAHHSAFRDITHGDNRVGEIGYSAGRGWDACTGLGSPVGAKLRALAGGQKAHS